MAVTERDLVVIGASAGGVEALIRLVAELPADLPAAVLVVLHVPSTSPSRLADILDRAGPLPARQAAESMKLEPGVILTAPPNHHLTVRDGRVRVGIGPRVNLHRPSVDVLFRSAAAERGSRTCGIVLSGALDDGTSGLRAIRQVGGITVVQDPADALVSSMPSSVLEVLTPDHVLAADVIGRRLPEILDESARLNEGPAMRSDVAHSPATATSPDERPPGVPSQFGCPDCGGVLWEVDDPTRLPFECRIGHAYSAQSLDDAQETRLEDALWAAVRTLEEQESLARHLLANPTLSGNERSRRRLERRGSQAHERADVVRGFLVGSVADDVEDATGVPESRTTVTS